MEIVQMNPAALVPYENNTKTHPPEQVDRIAESIKRFGWQQPIVVDRDNVVIIGHGRLMAAKQLMLDTVPVVYADNLTEEEAQALRLADNKTNESPWDFGKLEEELAALSIAGIDMTAFGFDELESETENTSAGTEEHTKQQLFSDEEIRADIVNGWETYATLEDFIKCIIDIPTAKYQYNRLLQGYNDGYNISLLFNPHRLTTETNHARSVFDAFNNYQKYRENFARCIVQQGNKIVPVPQYYKYINLGYADIQYVNEFPPYMARDIYKKYCKDGDRILNPCAGWGGRIIGLSAAGFKDIEYWETDPSIKTYNGLLELKKFLRLGDEYKTFNKPFEVLEIPDDYFDFVFTSPPYFDTERYSDEETQSYKGKENYKDWRDGFLYVMLDKIYRSMKKGALCILNVGHARYPIDDDIIEYMRINYGIKCVHESDFKIGGYGIGERTNMKNREDDDTIGEPFLLFKKE